MYINRKILEEKVEEIKRERKISKKAISEIMKIDASYLFKLLKKNANPGNKAIEAIENFCNYFDVNINEIIFFDQNVSCKKQPEDLPIIFSKEELEEITSDKEKILKERIIVI